MLALLLPITLAPTCLLGSPTPGPVIGAFAPSRPAAPGLGRRSGSGPGLAVRLAGALGVVAPYPLGRAARHPRRNLRPSSRRPSHRRGGGLSPARPGRGLIHSCRLRAA